MRALDLFHGLGGWSDGLASEGFYVLGVEIEPRIVALYKHPSIIADVRTLDGRRFRGFDLIVGSPPCRDFSRMCDHGERKEGFWRWRKPKNPEAGIQLVKAFLRIVEEARPKFWLMENVKGLSDYLDVEPRFEVKLSRTMVRCFWGNFPDFLVPIDYSRPITMNIQGKLRAWERSRIPLPTAQALARAVKDRLEG